MSVDALRASSLAHQRKLHNQETRQKVELDMSKKAADANLDELRKSNRADIENLQNEHQNQINDQTIEKERKLEQIRMNMEETQRITDSELKRQQELHKKTTEERNETFRVNSELSREQQEMSLEDTNHRFNVAARDAHNRQLEHHQRQETLYRNQDARQKQEWDAKIAANRTQFNETYQVEGQKFDHLRRKQESDNKKVLKQNHERNEAKLSTQQDLHVKHEKKLNVENNRSLQAQEKMFEKKYQQQLGRHLEAEKNLEATNLKYVERSKDDLNSRVKVYQDRSNDPFFKFTHLKPEVKEELDHYLVKVKVPEYAKEEVLLSTNKRELVLTFNRRYKESRTDEDGSQLKFDKVESTVTRTPVSQILDPRKMTREYTDGVLTFKVFKA